MRKPKNKMEKLNRVELLAGGLQMQGIGISEAIADQIILTLARVDLLKGEFSLKDAVEIKFAIEEKYGPQQKLSKAELPPLVIEIKNLKSEPRNVQLFSRSIISDAETRITMPIKYTRFDTVNEDGSIKMAEAEVNFSDVLEWVKENKPRVTKIMAVCDTHELITKTGLPLGENIWVNSSNLFGYSTTFPIQLKSGLVKNKLAGEIKNGFELNMDTSIFIPFAKAGKITLYLYRD